MKSRFSRPAVGAFELLFRPWMRRRLHAVRITGLPANLAPDRPLLLAANHVSWWDGFVLRELQRALRPGAPLYTVMSQAELARFPLFRLLGVVGIDGQSSGSIVGALRLLEARLHERPDAVVAYFPQGEMWPSYRRPLGFRRGVELVARRLATRVLPVGLHAEPLNAAAPTMFVAVGEPLEPGATAAEVERRVEAELDALLRFLAAHGEQAPLRWPDPWSRLGPAYGAAGEPR